MPDNLAKILIVDDEPHVVRLCEYVLRDEGYDVSGVLRGDEALRLMTQSSYDLLITDFNMPMMSGFELMRQARQLSPHLAIVALTGHSSPEYMRRAFKAGVQGLIFKPLKVNSELVDTVKSALEQHRRAQETLRLKAFLPLFEVTQAMVSEVNLPRLYELILDAVEKETRCNRVSIMLLAPAEDELFIAASRGLPDDVVHNVREKLGEGIAGWVAKHKQPVLLDRQSQATRSLKDVIHREQISSALSVPLMVSGRVIGVLNATIINQQQHFTQADLELLSILGTQVAAALENARLYEQTLSRAQEFRLVSQINSSVSASLDLDQILNTTVEGIRHLFDVEAVSILLRDDDSDNLRFLTSQTEQRASLANLHLKVGQGIAGWVVAHGQTAIVSDVTQDERFYTAIDQATNFKTHSILCVPLQLKQNTIGAISLVNKRQAVFTLEDADVLNALATSVSVAITNANLLETIKTSEAKYRSLMENAGEAILLLTRDTLRIVEANAHTETLTGLTREALHRQTLYDLFLPKVHQILLARLVSLSLDQSTSFDDLSLARKDQTHLPVVISARPIDLGHETVLQLIVRDISHLRRMEQQLLQSEKMAATGRLAASLAHEINNPLQSIQTCLSLLIGRALPEMKRQNYINLANQEVERLIQLTQRMLNFYRPSTSARAPTDVKAVLDDVCALVRKRLEHDQVVLHREHSAPLPLIQAIPDQLKQVFLNLMLNAAQAMPRGGDLWISTAVDKTTQQVVIAFKDNGLGITTANLPKIFEPFYSTKDDGSGLGLTISYSIIERHGGRIEVDSETGKGSTFTVRLPMGG